jgi:hypothetical protein
MKTSNIIREIRFAHDIQHIDLLMTNLKMSNYVSYETRGRVIRLIQHESPTYEMTTLVSIFSQPHTTYITRAIIRRVLQLLLEIKERQVDISLLDKSLWTKEEWFCFFVDNNTLIKPFSKLLREGLSVCRYNITSSLFTVNISGKKKEDEFYRNLMDACNESNEYLIGLNEQMARSIFNYHGNVVIVGRLDCGVEIYTETKQVK